MVLQVKPKLLYMPGMNDNRIIPDEEADFDLFDRVVVAKESHSVPLGYRGTIIGLQQLIDPNPVRQVALSKPDMYYDVLFDKSFDDGSSIEPNIATKKVFKVSQLHLINISYGRHKFMSEQATTDNKPTDKSNESAPQPSADGISVANYSAVVAGTIASTSTTSNTESAAAAAATIEATTAATTAVAAPPMATSTAASIPKHAPAQNDIWEMLKKQAPPQHQPSIDVNQFLMEKLKIGANASPITEKTDPHPAGSSHEQFRKIDVGDMFKVDPNTLPKPPTNWRNSQNDVGVYTLKNSRPPAPTSNIFHPQPKMMLPRGPAVPLQQHQHQPQQPQQYHPQQNRQQSNRNGAQGSSQYFYNQQFYRTPTPQGPNGPQNLSPNGVYPPGQGAFIPLQAARKHTKNKPMAAAAAAAPSQQVSLNN